MTPEEINQRIAEWVGIASQYACHADGKIYETCVIDLNERHDCVHASSIETKEQCERWMQRRDIPTPDYYHTNAAMDLLGVLVERGYSPCLYWCIGNKWSIELYFDGDYVLGVSKETIPAAICTAIIEMIEREGR